MRSSEEISQRLREMYDLEMVGSPEPETEISSLEDIPKELREPDEVWEKCLDEQPEYANGYKEGYYYGERYTLEWVLGGERKEHFEHP